jgi:hypothetical protein
MTEAHLQTYLFKQAKAKNLYARKMAAVGWTGFPDVLLAGPGGYTFIELKHPNGKGRLSMKQVTEINKMVDEGLEVLVIHTREEVDDVIRKIAHR